MLALNPKSPELKTRLSSVRSKALLKRLDEQVKTQKGYDVFSQGKSYLQTALKAGDASMRSVAFEQALGRSKSEKDIETFLKTAFAMAKAATSPQKRADLPSSMADATLAITRFYITLKIWRRILDERGVSAATKAATYEKMVKLVVMLHDLPQLTSLLSSGYAKGLAADTVKSYRQLLGLTIDAPVSVSPQVVQLFARGAESDEEWLSLYMAQGKMPEAVRRETLSKINAYCQSARSSAVCKWSRWPEATTELGRFRASLLATPATIASVEPSAGKMNAILELLKGYSGSGEPQLDIMVTLASGDVYEIFAAFLSRTAAANKEVATILQQKANESVESAKTTRAQCQKVIASSELVSPINAYCARGKLPTAAEALRWPQLKSLSISSNDAHAPEIVEMQKKLFVNRKDWKIYLDLGEMYLNKNLWAQAAATATFGTSNFDANREEFSALLGCAALNMNLLSEARFHLNKASELNGHKQQCLAQIRTRARAN